ncbi:hypothetical protein BDV96DRAFT_406238 [Lophiotrema nucula]|uniref:Secreted protein n=1 Tax=Lophiotrema nucula TaxID=690887 RepID=A0A6A5ZEI8_9PLEO|nr:hypothetical protein BDV96DRAFT_406238 [Lophiotrema nucula]
MMGCASLRSDWLAILMNGVAATECTEHMFCCYRWGVDKTKGELIRPKRGCAYLPSIAKMLIVSKATRHRSIYGRVGCDGPEHERLRATYLLVFLDHRIVFNTRCSLGYNSRGGEGRGMKSEGCYHCGVRQSRICQKRPRSVTENGWKEQNSWKHASRVFETARKPDGVPNVARSGGEARCIVG